MGYEKRNDAIVDKNFYFGCDIVLFSRVLKEKKEFEIAHQLIKYRTSIRAKNVRESRRGVSTKRY